jgi:hypothetical protein
MIVKESLRVKNLNFVIVSLEMGCLSWRRLMLTLGKSTIARKWDVDVSKPGRKQHLERRLAETSQDSA